MRFLSSGCSCNQHHNILESILQDPHFEKKKKKTHDSLKGFPDFLGAAQDAPDMVYKCRNTYLRVPSNKDYGLWGSILESPYLGKLPCGYQKLGSWKA